MGPGTTPCIYIPCWTPRRGRSYKMPSVCMSVCLSVCMYVCMSQPSSLNQAYNFADFWYEGRGPLVKKSDRARFGRKIQNWGFLGAFRVKNRPKMDTLLHSWRNKSAN